MHASGAYTAFAVRAIGPMGFVMRICNFFLYILTFLMPLLYNILVSVSDKRDRL